MKLSDDTIDLFERLCAQLQHDGASEQLIEQLTALIMKEAESDSPSASGHRGSGR